MNCIQCRTGQIGWPWGERHPYHAGLCHDCIRRNERAANDVWRDPDPFDLVQNYLDAVGGSAGECR